MRLSWQQTLIVLACVGSATFLAAANQVDGTSVAMGLVALAGNALGTIVGWNEHKRSTSIPPIISP